MWRHLSGEQGELHTFETVVSLVPINVSKSIFGAHEVKYLGYLVNADGTKPLEDKVNALKNYKLPKDRTELRRFLGMVNFYRRFIPNAAQAQAPLNSLLIGAKKKDRRIIHWNEEQIKAFEETKCQLLNATLLAHPLEKVPLALKTDASDIAMGATLEQWQDDKWQPLGFYSKKFSDAQCKYSTYDRELLAIYSGIKFFRHMVEGRNLIIKTDHKPLTFAFRQKSSKASPRQLLGEY